MGLIPLEQIEIASYGCEALLYTIVSTAGLLLIGGINNKIIEAAVIIGIFYTNQSLGGGFHASTHVKCFLVMAIGLTVSIKILRLDMADIVIDIIMLLACTTLIFIPLKLHHNKAFLKLNSAQFILKSRVAVCLEICAFVLVSLTGLTEIRNSIAIGAILSVCSTTPFFQKAEPRALNPQGITPLLMSPVLVPQLQV